MGNLKDSQHNESQSQDQADPHFSLLDEPAFQHSGICTNRRCRIWILVIQLFSATLNVKGRRYLVLSSGFSIKLLSVLCDLLPLTLWASVDLEIEKRATQVR